MPQRDLARGVLARRVEERIERLAQRREPQPVVDQFGVVQRELLLVVQQVLIEHQRFEFAEAPPGSACRPESRSSRATSSRRSGSPPGRCARCRARRRSGSASPAAPPRNMCLPFTETGMPFSKPIVTSPGLFGASFGLFVSIQISSGAALAGSSSAPPSCEMCQMLRSRL